jgi:histone H3/H4
VSDYLDAFIDEAARGAIRLAKHRKGNKVELKDMALYLGTYTVQRLSGEIADD